MAEKYGPGGIVPQSGIYTITHDPVHAQMPHEVTVIKGRRFPTCRHCKGISFRLAHAAKHISEVEHLKEPEVARCNPPGFQLSRAGGARHRGNS